MEYTKYTEKQFRRLTILFTLFVVSFFICNTVLAKTEKQCLVKMAKDTKHSVDQVTKIIMECNNMFIDGETLYLNSNKFTDRVIRKRFPASNPEYKDVVTQLERAERLIQYTECQTITYNMSRYMTKCLGEK